jgi:outer membrane lipoprotein
MTENIYKRIIQLAAVTLLFSACTTIPEQLQGTYTEISPARVEPSVYGSSVLWGGVIIDAKNKENNTCFEILSREMDKYRRPLVEDRTSGRFIACKPGFYDPEVFAKGREVTITGTIRNIEARQIDEFSYRYPVLDIDELVLWEVRRDVLVYNNYDPFYYPYYWGYGFGYGYPYHRYPYYGGFPRRSYGGTARIRQTLPDPAVTSPRHKP